MSKTCKDVDTVVFTILSLLFVHSVQPCAYVSNNENTVLVSALLPVRDGPNCSRIQLQGIQQMAALTKVINEVNSDLNAQEGLTLGLQVHDTCSTPEGAVKAVLSALVENGQTCHNPPLFLGFIGLEDASSLLAVRAITKMFNATHFLPYLLENPKLLPEQNQNVIQVAKQNYKEQAKTILALIQKLHWKVLSVVFEDTVEPLVQEVINSVKETHSLCISGTITRITHEKIRENIFSETEGISDGTIVLLDTPETALRLFQIQETGNISLVISINKVGLHAWQVPHLFSNLFLLQQTSISLENLLETMDPILTEQYNMQEYNKCTATKNTSFCEAYQASNRKLSNSMDASITPLSHTLRLLGSGLRVAHRVRCRKFGEEVAVPGICEQLRTLTVNEWQEFLRRSSSFSRSAENPTSVGIHVDMELPAYYDLYTVNPMSTKLEKIGKLRKGSFINTSGYVFPTNQHEMKCPVSSQDPQLQMKKTVSQNTYNYNSTLLDNLYLYKEYSSYQLIGLICGVGVGMLIFMIIIIFGVYNMFRVKTGRSGRSSSINTSPSVRRRRRGSVTSNRSA